MAIALTYEEALRQSVSDSTSDFDPNGVVESVSSFVTDNPILLFGGFAVLAVPLAVSRLFSKPKPWGVETAKTAYAKLSDDSNAQLIDIRPFLEFKQVGSPDIFGLKKKTITIVYKGEDKVGFLNKLAVKLKEPENTTLFILDNEAAERLKFCETVVVCLEEQWKDIGKLKSNGKIFDSNINKAPFKFRLGIGGTNGAINPIENGQDNAIDFILV